MTYPYPAKNVPNLVPCLDLGGKRRTWLGSAGLGPKVLGLGQKTPGLEPEALGFAEASGLAKPGQVQSSAIRAGFFWFHSVLGGMGEMIFFLAKEV